MKNSFGDTLTDPKLIADLLNIKFTKLGDYFGRHIGKPPVLPCETTARFGFEIISDDACYKMIRALDSTKPAGPLAIPPWILKDGIAVIVPHLTFLINICILHNYFPDELKLADVTAIFKKGDPLNPVNYRPISVTGPISKMFEKVLEQQLCKFLTDHRILSSNQFGFRKGFSSIDALLNITEKLRTEMDQNNWHCRSTA